MKIMRILNIKPLLFALGLLLLGACDGRRDFPPLTETGVTIDRDIILLISGETLDVTARFIPDIFPAREYTWEVDDPSVADVITNDDQSVSLTATGSGETLLRITSLDADALTASVRLQVISSAPIDVTDQATLSVYRENSGGPGAGEGSPKLVDGDTSTKYLTGYLTPFFLTLEFETPRIINIYRFTSANDAASRDPRDWQISGSNDGENWEVLDERTNEFFNERFMTREFYFDNNTPYTYYRLDITSNNGGSLFQMAEWSVYAFPED